MTTTTESMIEARAEELWAKPLAFRDMDGARAMAAQELKDEAAKRREREAAESKKQAARAAELDRYQEALNPAHRALVAELGDALEIPPRPDDLPEPGSITNAYKRELLHEQSVVVDAQVNKERASLDLREQAKRVPSTPTDSVYRRNHIVSELQPYRDALLVAEAQLENAKAHWQSVRAVALQRSTWEQLAAADAELRKVRPAIADMDALNQEAARLVAELEAVRQRVGDRLSEAQLAFGRGVNALHPRSLGLARKPSPPDEPREIRRDVAVARFRRAVELPGKLREWLGWRD